MKKSRRQHKRKRNTRRRRRFEAAELAKRTGLTVSQTKARNYWDPTFTNALAQHEAMHKLFWSNNLCKTVKFGQISFLRDFHFGDKKLMNISVIHEDDTENEIELELCCATCSAAYGWTAAQFVKVWDMATKSEPIKIPSSVDSPEKFKQFVKTL